MRLKKLRASERMRQIMTGYYMMGSRQK